MDLLVPLNIFGKGFGQAFGVLWGEQDARFYAGLWNTGHDLDEVDHELALRVGDNGKVRVGSFCDFFAQLYIEVGLILIVVFHAICVYPLQGLVMNKGSHFSGKFFCFLPGFFSKIATGRRINDTAAGIHQEANVAVEAVAAYFREASALRAYARH